MAERGVVAGLMEGVRLLVVRRVVQIASRHGIAEREVFRRAQHVAVPELWAVRWIQPSPCRARLVGDWCSVCSDALAAHYDAHLIHELGGREPALLAILHEHLQKAAVLLHLEAVNGLLKLFRGGARIIVQLKQWHCHAA